jgi:integrase
VSAAASRSLAALADRPYQGERLRARLTGFLETLRLGGHQCRDMQRAAGSLLALLDERGERTLQERWETVESERWPGWDAGHGRLQPAKRWTWGASALVLSRAVRPGWILLPRARLSQWLGWLPEDHALPAEFARLQAAVAGVEWSHGQEPQRRAALLGLRVLLAGGHDTLEQIRDEDLKRVPVAAARGIDILDAVLCGVGALDRTPQQGAQRRLRRGRLSPAELVAGSRVPERFRAVHQLYLETYAQRISDVYATTRHKHNALEHLWAFLDEHHPEVRGSSDVRREHLLAFIPHAIGRAREVQRRQPHLVDGDRLTAHQWLVNVRCFFADVCVWSTEPGSPFAALAPPAVPLERRDLVGIGFDKARRRQASRQQASVLDLERAVPPIRALALRRWQDAQQALAAAADDPAARAGEVEAFWDWALLELLLQSGLRIEEACELTTLDVLKRRQPDGRVYYLLHIKPSKFDRARAIPIGDGLGRVIAAIIEHVKAFYRADQVPACDHWDCREKLPYPRAPYLLQGAGHPSPICMSAIRNRLARLSRHAGATRADGSALRLRPHDCRRLFASEHLNHNTPVHVIQALLGHAAPDTVMVYAKLYPSTLVEEYRKTVRATYADFHGPDSLRAPTLDEWQQFSANCNLRDMGTHLCALPTGDHCARGLVCLGCSHAQPKQSAAPVFRRMLASHRRSLGRAREAGEPAGQLAARELEIQRIDSALRRAEELSADAAAALEAVA